MRTCFRNIENTKEFELIEFKDLRKGDLFRLFDNDNPVINQDGFSVFKAESDAYLNAEGIWQIDIVDSLTEK
jgi:hypothetical protein